MFSIPPMTSYWAFSNAQVILNNEISRNIKIYYWSIKISLSNNYGYIQWRYYVCVKVNKPHNKIVHRDGNRQIESNTLIFTFVPSRETFLHFYSISNTGMTEAETFIPIPTQSPIAGILSIFVLILNPIFIGESSFCLKRDRLKTWFYEPNCCL